MKENDLENMVLDAYFSTRAPKVDTVDYSAIYVEDSQTTEEIVEALSSTYPLTQQTVVEYMVNHGYLLVPEIDGSLVWKIWRIR